MANGSPPQSQSQPPRDPFGATPDVSAYVPRPAVDAVLDALIGAVRGYTGIVVLQGPPGLGKTLLLRVLAERLSGEFRPLLVPFSSLPPEGLWRWILGAQGLPCGAQPRVEVKAALQGLAESDRQQLLLIDDASALPRETAAALGELRAELPDALRCVLVAGDDDASGGVLDALGTQLRTIRLDTPMSRAETADYVRSRIASAGHSESTLARFDDTTLARVHECAEGIPARVHEVADLILRPEDAARHHEYSRELRPEAVRGAAAGRATERVVDWADEDLARAVAGRRRAGSVARRPSPAAADDSDEEILLADVEAVPQSGDAQALTGAARTALPTDEASRADRAAAHASPPVQPGEGAPRPGRRRLVPLASAATLAVALVGAGAWWLSGSGGPARSPAPPSAESQTAPVATAPKQAAAPEGAAAIAKSPSGAAEAAAAPGEPQAAAQQVLDMAQQGVDASAAPSPDATAPKLSATSEAAAGIAPPPSVAAATPAPSEPPVTLAPQPEASEAQQTAASTPAPSEPPVALAPQPEASEAQQTAASTPAPSEPPVAPAPQPEASEAQQTAASTPAPSEPPVAPAPQPEASEAQQTAAAQAKASPPAPAVVTAAPRPARKRASAPKRAPFPKARAGASPPPELAVEPPRRVQASETPPGMGEPVVTAPLRAPSAATSERTPAATVTATPSASAPEPAVSAAPTSASDSSSEPVGRATSPGDSTVSAAAARVAPKPTKVDAANLLPVRVRARSGAAVEIDGEPHGRAPLIGVLLAPGRHRVVVTHPDGVRVEKEAMIDADHLVVTFD